MNNPYYAGPRTDHFDGHLFFNPGLPPSDKSIRDLLRWKLSSRAEPWPELVPARIAPPPPSRSDAPRITHIGHASTLLQVAGHNLLIDPVYSERASPFSFSGPKRHNPSGIPFDQLPPIHTILITHNHYDHLDLPTLRRLWATHRAPIVTTLGNDSLIHRHAPEIKVNTGDWFSTHTLASEITVTLTPAYHWSSRSLRDRRMALWSGFLLQTPSFGPIYLSGDTAYGHGEIFRDLRHRFGPPALAILPIGAYEPRWFMHSQHADPADAVQIFLDLSCPLALGTHWNTFALTDEGPEDPALALTQALKLRSLPPDRFLPLRPGDVWSASVTQPS